MNRFDWRDLYAKNQAAIQRSGVPPMAMAQATATPAGPTAVRAGGVDLLRRLPDAPPALARGAGMRAFTVGGRQRHALVHTPSGVGVDTAAPLLCLLHGCTQTPADFAAATRIEAAAERHGFVVVLPAQDRADNTMGCWNWFEPGHWTRGRGEPAAIAGILGELIGGTDVRIDPHRVFVCGLSSGAAMAAILAATHPDLFAAAAMHSGLAYGSASDMSSAFAAMRNGGPDPIAQGRAAHAAMGTLARAVPTMIVHGSADATVAPVNAQQLLQQTMTANRLAAPDCADLEETRPSALEREQPDGGYAYTRARWRDRRGALMHELLLVEGLGHAWSGGEATAAYSDPRGPDATAAIIRFFADTDRRLPV